MASKPRALSPRAAANRDDNYLERLRRNYELQKNGKTKQPNCFEVNDGSLFGGLWNRRKDMISCMATRFENFGGRLSDMNLVAG